MFVVVVMDGSGGGGDDEAGATGKPQSCLHKINCDLLGFNPKSSKFLLGNFFNSCLGSLSRDVYLSIPGPCCGRGGALVTSHAWDKPL
jgi:hypothetical protein